MQGGGAGHDQYLPAGVDQALGGLLMPLALTDLDRCGGEDEKCETHLPSRMRKKAL